MNQTLRVPFREVFSVARKTAAGYEVTELDLAIAGFASTTRIRTMAALYEYFRLANLNVEVVSDCNGTWAGVAVSSACAFSHAIAFIPSALPDYSAPTQYSDLMQFPDAQMGHVSRVLRLKLARKQLEASTPVKWYHTSTTGSVPAADSSPGTLTLMTYTAWVQSAQLANHFVIVSGVAEFKAPLIGGAALARYVTPTVTISEPGSPYVIPGEEKIDQRGRPSGRQRAPRIETRPYEPSCDDTQSVRDGLLISRGGVRDDATKRR